MRYFSVLSLLLFINFKTASAQIYTQDLIKDLAELPLHCIPTKTPHFQKQAWKKHPIFFGCYDWHSAVHSHWSLLKIYEFSNDEELRNKIIDQLSNSISSEKAEKEARNFKDLRFWEVPYGVSWYLKFLDELAISSIPKAKTWIEMLSPLSEKIKDEAHNYLRTIKKVSHSGQHHNTAFSLKLMLEFANNQNDSELKSKVLNQAKALFENLKDCKLENEPKHRDFVSPCFTVANLMSDILPTKDFGNWLKEFMPGLMTSEVLNIFQPGEAHQMGLLFYRSYAFKNVSKKLPSDHEYKIILSNSAEEHFQEALQYINLNDYKASHWLASFALRSIELNQSLL